MTLFKQGDELLTNDDLLDFTTQTPIKYFYKDIDPGFGGIKVKYFDVIYAVDLKTIQALSENYSNDLEDMYSNEHPNFIQDMNRRDLDIEEFFNTAFRVLNNFSEHDGALIIPRIYFISYSDKYLDSKDPVGILMNPVPSIKIIRTDPVSNHDLDNIYKISTYKVKNSEYINYLKTLEVSTDSNNMKIYTIKMGEVTRDIKIDSDENRLVLMIDKCKCLFNGYKDTNDEMVDMFDRVKSSIKGNLLLSYFKTLLASKQVYIFSRYEIFSHQDSYNREIVSLYSAANVSDIKDLYLLGHGSEYKYYKNDEYVEVDDIRDMVSNSNTIEDRLPIVINKNGTNIQLLSILIILVAIALIVYTVLLYV